MEIEGKNVLITGASRAIGRALALEFARHGARVACCARDAETLNETVRLIEREGGTGRAFPADITNGAAVDAMMEQVEDEWGALDVLFNNAGRFHAIGGAWEVDPDDWWADVTVNLFGALRCIRSVLPRMKARDSGVILNMNGGRPPGGSGYAAGKAGLMELSRLLVEELKAEGSSVYVFTAGPGLVRSPMTEYQAETAAGRRWLPSVGERLDRDEVAPAEAVAKAAIRMLRVARPDLRGTHFTPDTDFDSL